MTWQSRARTLCQQCQAAGRASAWLGQQGSFSAVGGSQDASLGLVGKGLVLGLSWASSCLVLVEVLGLAQGPPPVLPAVCSAMAGLPVPILQPRYHAGLAPGPSSCTRQCCLVVEANLSCGTWTPFHSANGCLALATAHSHARWGTPGSWTPEGLSVASRG